MGIRDRLKATLEAARGVTPAQPNTPARPARSPRADAWYSNTTGLGVAGYDATSTLNYRGVDLTARPTIIRELLRFSALARKVCEKQVLLAWSNGVTFDAAGPNPQALEVLESEVKRLELERKIKRARTLGRAFGGSLLVISVEDGLTPVEPLQLERVRRVLFLRPVDRWDVASIEYDTTGGPRDGEPETYTITNVHGSQVRIHYSRVVRFNGAEVDRRTRQNNGGWNDSVLQTVYNEIRDIDAGGQSLSAQLQRAVQVVYKIKGLHNAILAQNREFVEDWIQSVEHFRSNFRAIGLDKDGEDVTHLAAPLESSVKVWTALQARVASAADMPQVELFGTPPAGLSSDDASARIRFYDKIESEEQRGEQGTALDYLLPIIGAQAARPELSGAVLSYVWPSLQSPTDLEVAQQNKLVADTVAVFVSTGDLQAGDYRQKAADMLNLDLEVAATDADVDAQDPTDRIVDPVERLQQGRLAIQSGLLHLPDTARTFRPLLGLPALEPGETNQWFNLVKTTGGPTGDVGDIPDQPPLDVPDEMRGDALAIIKSRFVDQATRLVKDKPLNLWPRFLKIIDRELSDLEPLEIQGLTVYIEDQWETLPVDLEDFMSTRDPDNYDQAEVLRMMRRRARLRADQIVRMVEQAYERQEMRESGEQFFVWTIVDDERTRPEHRAISGNKYPLSTGHPEFGFPGDPHGCRCTSQPVPVEDVTRGDAETFKPPAAVQRAAQQALDARRELPPSQRAMTPVGLARARDLANGRPISEDVARRMLSYFQRHEIDKQSAAWTEQDWSKGKQAWFGWGGDAGYEWVLRIVRDLDSVDGRGDAPAEPSKTPAKPEERIKGSKQNEPGSASGRRGGIEIDAATETALKRKLEEHNADYSVDATKRADLGTLKAVYRRGAGAFSTSHRPRMTRGQWSMARVNAFLKLLQDGKPENAKYTTDNDLLPEKHPRFSGETK